MKPRFELWDSDSANFLGAYEAIPDVVDDLRQAFSTPESRMQITDFERQHEVGGDDDEAMVLLTGVDLYLLVHPGTGFEGAVRSS